jgi:hypothetical protein
MIGPLTGCALGLAMGVIIWMETGSFTIGMGSGLVLGLSLGGATFV